MPARHKKRVAKKNQPAGPVKGKILRIEHPPVCGPDATDWFIEELNLWLGFCTTLNTLAIAWGTAQNNARPFYDLTPRWVDIRAQRYRLLLMLAPQLTYHPTTTFNSRRGYCPISCEQTLTLCDGCIHRSEVGNFIYAAIAVVFQMTWLEVFIGSIRGNRGRRTASDRASVSLGFDFANQINPPQLCHFLSNHAQEWQDMQQDGHGCSLCAQSVVPSNRFHTIFPPLTTLGPRTNIRVTIPSLVQGTP